MYLEKNSNINFYGFLIFSLLLHIFLLIFLPGIREKELIKDEKIKKIKAGIVILKDDTEIKKKAAAKKKKVAKKQEIKKQITPVKKVEKKEIKKKEIKKLDLSAIKKRTKQNSETTSVLSIEKTDINVNRTVTRDSNLPIETNISSITKNVAENRKIIDIKSEKMEESKEIKDLKSVNLKSEKVDVKLLKPVETLNDTKKLDDTIETENLVDLGGKESELSLPKNIVSQLIEGNGTVEWLESNKLPDYPEEAEKNAWNGKVSIILVVRNGETLYSQIDQKSAYPSIDRAVERVAREWRILIKSDSGMLVDGKVRITVKFDFE